MFLAQSFSALRLCQLESKHSAFLSKITEFYECGTRMQSTQERPRTDVNYAIKSYTPLRGLHGGPCSERRRRPKKNNAGNPKSTNNESKNFHFLFKNSLPSINISPKIATKPTLTECIQKFLVKNFNESKKFVEAFTSKDNNIDPHLECGVFKSDESESESANTTGETVAKERASVTVYTFDKLNSSIMFSAPTYKGPEEHPYNGLSNKRLVKNFRKNYNNYKSFKTAKTLHNKDNLRVSRDNKSRIIKQLVMNMAKYYTPPTQRK